MDNSTTSSGGGPRLPPGFRFHPTDEELVVHYLKRKISSDPLPVAIIAEIDLYKYDPWELPSKASFGEQEWYFFSPRERKYPNGERPNRAATSGYWKATGTDKPILTANGAQKIGVKKALVFYGGKPPKGVKTNWIMHEYRLLGDKSAASKPPTGISMNNKKASLRLDDWVLCRIFKKTNSSSSRSMEDGLLSPNSSMDGYNQQNSYLTGGYRGNNIFFSMLPENGPESHSINPTIPNISSLKPDFSKHVFPSEYWNGMSTNGTIMFSSNNQWEGGDDGDEDDHDSNPRGSSSSSIDHQRNNNLSYISLLNQQYHPQMFHQNSIVNNSTDGIFDQFPNPQGQ